MKKASRLLTLAVAGFFATQVHAEGAYLGLGLGLQFDLAGLGETITKDGLDTNKWNNFDATNVTAGTLPTQQKLIVPENEVDVYQQGGLMTGKTSGVMNGGILSVFWEKEGDSFFWRAGVDYTKKIMGGKTEATFATVKWLDQYWDYHCWNIPVYAGMKAGVGETASVYGGLGLNYYSGGWEVGGTNNGQIPFELSNGYLTPGAHFNQTIAQIQAGATPTGGGPVLGEQIRFHKTGIGFNFLMGIERKLQSGNKTYFEIEHVIAGGMDNAPVRSYGSLALSSAGNVSYPINLSGTRFKFGVKVAM